MDVPRSRKTAICRDVDGCPIDNFHMATCSPDFETEGLREK